VVTAGVRTSEESCDPLERLDITEASALAALMISFRNRIMQNRCPCGQIESALEAMIAIAPCFMAIATAGAVASRCGAIVDGERCR
jgi:hypothetical protein